MGILTTILAVLFAMTIPVYAAEIHFDKEEVEVNVGENVLIQIDDGSFPFISEKIEYDNNMIAVTKVEDKYSHLISLQITGRQTGCTTIKISNPFFETVCDVKINQLIENIQISKPDEIIAGETYKLDYDIIPSNATNKILKWYSSDNNILTIDNNGILTAVNEGVAIILCESEDGNAQTEIEVMVKPQISGIECQSDYYIGVDEKIDFNIVTLPNKESIDNDELIYEMLDGNSVAIKNNIIIGDNIGISKLKISLKSNITINTVVNIYVFSKTPTEKQIKIYNAINEAKGYDELDVCQKFVRDIYDLTFNTVSYSAGSALEAMNKWSVGKIADDMYNIPVGATLYSGTCSEYGHVGYYDGMGYVIHQNDGRKQKTELKEFISYYNATTWGWQNGDDLSL